MMAAWMLTFWLFAVGWFCCNCQSGTTICECCASGTDPGETVAVTISGISSADCDCSWLNATFWVTRVPGSGSLGCEQCRWEYVGEHPCGGAGSWMRVVLNITHPNPSQWLVTVGIDAVVGSDPLNYYSCGWWNVYTSPPDGQAEHILANRMPLNFTDLTEPCTGWATSVCTVN